MLLDLLLEVVEVDVERLDEEGAGGGAASPGAAFGDRLWRRSAPVLLALFLDAGDLLTAGPLGLIGLPLGMLAGYAYAGLLGVFTVALFTRRGSAASVRRGLVTGALVILATEPRVQGLVLDSTALAFPWRLTLGTLLAAAVTLGASDALRGKITAP